MSTNPRTVDEVFKDFKGRRSGMLKALTTGRLSLRAVWEQADERLCVALFLGAEPCKGSVSCVGVGSHVGLRCGTKSWCFVANLQTMVS